MHIDVSNKTILVTGASRGIGKHIALAFSQAGAHVIGTATSQSGANQISAFLGERGQGCVYNANEPQAADILFSQLQQQRIMVLINNAGITNDNLFVRMNDTQLQEVVQVNLVSMMSLTKVALKPMMKARNGRIINISSVVAATGNAGQCNYAATKSGVEGFTRSLAREVASRNITVNAIAPGYIATDMTNKLDSNQKQAILHNVPLGRMGEPADVASACVFLASDGASYITGHTLHINGGMFMT